MTASVQWVCCDGGPHILMERRLANIWEGASPPSGGRIVRARSRFGAEGESTTDYDAACDVDGYLGMIGVGDGAAIVLGDDVPMSRWFADGPDAGLLVVLYTWEEELDDGAVQAMAAMARPELFEDTRLHYRIVEPDLLLFPACDCPPNWVYGCAEIVLRPGSYRILAANSVVSKEGELRVFKFLRV